MPSSRHARITRTAISPRVAMTMRRIECGMSIRALHAFDLEVNHLRAVLVQHNGIQIESKNGRFRATKFRYAGYDFGEPGDVEFPAPSGGVHQRKELRAAKQLMRRGRING